MLSLSNVWFLLISGYFGPAAERQPLLHTWSLAVEEQFYALFPLVMAILWRWGRRAVLATLLMMTLISLGLCEWWMRSGGRPGAAFYLPPFRIWELLIGSLVAMLPAAALDRLPARRSFGESVSLAGLAIVVGGMVWYDETTVFPGFAALVPTLGAALVIAFADGHTFVGRLLAHPVPVRLGLISYSTYLVHQPLFAFARIAAERRLSVVESVMALTASIVVGYLCWRFIEQPFRNRERVGGRAIVTAGAGITVVVAAVSWVIFRGGGIPDRFPESNRQLAIDLDRCSASKYVRDRFLVWEHRLRPFDHDGQPRLLVIGDSYAQDFVNCLCESGKVEQFQVRTIYIPARRQPYLGDEDPLEFVPPGQRAAVARDPDLRGCLPAIREADVIVLASAWEQWAAERLPGTLERIPLRPDQQLFVLGTKCFEPPRPLNYMQVPPSKRHAMRAKVNEYRRQVNETLSAVVPPGVFLNLQSIICDPRGEVILFTEDGRALSYDGSHLTREGARWIGRRMCDSTPLSEIMRK